MPINAFKKWYIDQKQKHSTSALLVNIQDDYNEFKKYFLNGLQFGFWTFELHRISQKIPFRVSRIIWMAPYWEPVVNKIHFYFVLKQLRLVPRRGTQIRMYSALRYNGNCIWLPVKGGQCQFNGPEVIFQEQYPW